jgi:hypothetical protein
MAASRSASNERNSTNSQQIDIEADLDISRQDCHLVPPINRLPTELLAKIFTHCLPEQPMPFSSKTAPLFLGGIRNHWRIIALVTPLL